MPLSLKFLSMALGLGDARQGLYKENSYATLDQPNQGVPR